MLINIKNFNCLRLPAMYFGMMNAMDIIILHNSLNQIGYFFILEKTTTYFNTFKINPLITNLNFDT